MPAKIVTFGIITEEDGMIVIRGFHIEGGGASYSNIIGAIIARLERALEEQEKFITKESDNASR